MDLQDLGRDHGLRFSGSGQGKVAVHVNALLDFHIP